MADCKYKINIKEIQNRYKFKVFMRSGADIPKSITDDISSIKSSNEELKRSNEELKISNNELKSSIEELKSETNKIIEENIKKKSQNQDMYNALRTIYTNNIKDKVVEKINLYPDIGDESIKTFENSRFWQIDRTQKFENKYIVRNGTIKWYGLSHLVNYKKPGKYKFTAYVKTSIDNEPIAIYGAGITASNKQVSGNYTGTRKWQKIELIFYKADIDVPDKIRVEKTEKNETILYISKFELTPFGEIEKIENEPKKIIINSLNLLDNTQINETLSREIISITNGEIKSKELSSWFGMILVYNQTILLKKDKIYQFSFDIKATNNTEDFQKAILINKAEPSKGIETTLNKLVTTYTLSTEYQRYVYYITPKSDVETNQIFIQHNGNKTTTNQYIVRNIMLSENTSNWDENYFKKSFIINNFNNTDDKFIELIDEMINLDLENKKYILVSE